MTQSPSVVPSKVTTFITWGSSDRWSLSFWICPSSSANTTWLSESLRMYVVSSTLVVG